MFIPSVHGKKRSEYLALATTMSGTMESKISSSVGARDDDSCSLAFFARIIYKNNTHMSKRIRVLDRVLIDINDI